MMDMDMPVWYGWEVYDDDGVCGVKEDAPDDVKKAFVEYQEKMEKAKAEGIKL